MKGIVSVEKGIRTYDYMKVRLDTFTRKHEKILEEHRIRKIAFERAEQTMVYMKCTDCGKMYVIALSDYLKNPLVFKDWICFKCETARIEAAEKIAVGKPRTYFRSDRVIHELTLPSRRRFYYAHVSDGTINGIIKRMCDMLGRKMYEVE